MGSPQWMSSNTTASGAVCATASRNDRTAQNVSSTELSRSAAANSCASVEHAGPSVPMTAQIFRSISSGASKSSRPAASFTTSPTGKNVIPSPYGRQRPRRTVASPSDPRNSSTSRDLPTPGVPRTVNS